MYIHAAVLNSLFTITNFKITELCSAPPLSPSPHLCQQFLGAPTGLDIHQSVMGVFDHPMPERTHPQLY